MPCSKKQLEANRRNAKRSTGPRTPEGKAISSRNATQHGLYAKSIVIESPLLKEDKQEYHRLVDSLSDEFHPTDDVQTKLVQRIADCLWLQKRAAAAETQFLERLSIRIGSLDSTSTLLLHGRFNRDLSRYEWFIDRELKRAVNSLVQLQSATHGPEMASFSHLTPKITHNEPISCERSDTGNHPTQRAL